jgi:zinc protease
MTQLDRTKPPTPADVRDFIFPAIKRDELPNGLALYAVPHGIMPLITFRLVVHAGGEHDTQGTAGLAYLTARSLEAGTSTRSADRLAWDFEKLGAELDVDVVWDYAALTVTAPADRAEAALALLAEVVLDPALAAEEIDRLKNEQVAELLQRDAEPRALASDQANRFIFAEQTPYHRPLPGLRETVLGFTADTVRNEYTSLWRAASAGLVAVGAIDADKLQDLASRHLGEWSGTAPQAKPKIASANHATPIHLVHRAGSVQSEIRVGHVGVPRKHPDYYPLVIANSILGGAFTSRLNMTLREKHGFTYGVRSAFGFRKHPGPFVIQTAVATDVTARALDVIWQETSGLLKDGPTEAEISAARDYLSGTIPLELETTEQIAARASEIFVFDLPEDYYAQHRDHLRQVTAAEAARAGRQHIRMSDFVVTIVGDAQLLEKDIGALNIGAIAVHEIDE